MNLKYLFQDPATDIMEGIIELHHYIMFFLVVVVIFVLWQIIAILCSFGQFSDLFFKDNTGHWGDFNESSRTIAPVWSEDNWKFFMKDVVLGSHKVVHGTAIEIIWTIIPSFILLAIAVPSFALLFTMDEIVEPLVTIKVQGHQWYWSYEYSDYVNNETGEPVTLGFDSYMIPDEELNVGDLRLLEVDNPLVLPINTPIRVLITASDVLHCWAVPSLGVKMDAVPGRLNQVSFTIKREGVFYGQCSEICGVNHGFMPIAVRAVSLDTYCNWLEKNLADLI